MRRLLKWISPRQLWTAEKWAIIAAMISTMVTSFFMPEHWSYVNMATSNVMSLYFMACIILSNRISMGICHDVVMEDIKATEALDEHRQAMMAQDPVKMALAQHKFNECHDRMIALREYLKAMP